MNNSSSITSLLADQASALCQLSNRARYLATLDRTVRALLPAAIVDHCRVANLRDNVLVLQAEGTVWATKLRYQLPQILTDLRRLPDLKGLDSIRIRIAPAQTAQNPSPLARPHLSEHSAELLQQAADATPDPELAAALRRVARHRRD